MLIGIRSIWWITICLPALLALLSGGIFLAAAVFRKDSDCTDCPCQAGRRKIYIILFVVVMAVHIILLACGAAYGSHLFKTHRAKALYNFYSHETVEEYSVPDNTLREMPSERITAWKDSRRDSILCSSIQIMKEHGATREEMAEMLMEKFGLTEEQSLNFLEQN